MTTESNLTDTVSKVPPTIKEPTDVDFEKLTSDNIEEELEKLRLFDDAYNWEEDTRDKVRLTSRGIDIRALRAGQNVEFDFDFDKEEDNFNWEDEEDVKIDYEKIYRYRNLDVIAGGDDDANENAENIKTPFEKLRLKMFDVTPEKSRGVLKRTLIPGIGPCIPKGSLVRIHYNAYFEMNDEPFDSTHLRNKTFEFKLGANCVVIGLDIAVATMKKHEKSQFIFEPYYYCGEKGCEPRVPRNTPVLFEIEIISFVEANPYEEYQNTPEEQRKKLTVDQVLIICHCLREHGNDNYRRKNLREAAKKYRKAIFLLENTSAVTMEEEEKIKAVLLKLYLNMSQICIKESKPKKAIFYCKSALDIDQINIKAIFRYGQSLRILQDFDRSRKFLQKAYKMAPTDKDILAELEKLDKMIANYKLVETDFYKKMFSKSNQADNKSTTDENNNSNKDGDSHQKQVIVRPKQITAESIIQKLEDFKNDDKVKVYTIQTDLYTTETIDFIGQKAIAMDLTVRSIKGATNIMQIMKN